VTEAASTQKLRSERKERQRERAASAPATPSRKPSAIAAALIHKVESRPSRSWSSRLTTGAKWKL
jgi:hypothetical protein